MPLPYRYFPAKSKGYSIVEEWSHLSQLNATSGTFAQIHCPKKSVGILLVWKLINLSNSRLKKFYKNQSMVYRVVNPGCLQSGSKQKIKVKSKKVRKIC
jgi:hypothetical protein